jgi:predicted MFS family arabinose efflux permease
MREPPGAWRTRPARPASPFAIVWVLAAGAFTVNLDSRAIIPVLPSLADDLGVGIATAGFVATAYMFPYGAFQLAYGPLADRVGRVAVARLTMLGFAVGTTACAFAPTFEVLVALRFLTGATAAAVFPMGLAFIGDAFPYKERPAAISILATGSALAQLFSLALGGILAGFVSWRAVFVLDGVLAFACVAALLWVRAPAPSGPRTSALAGYRTFVRTPSALAFVAIGILEGGLLFGGLTYLGAFLRDGWGLPYPTIGLVLAAYGAASVIGSRLLPWYARRVSEPRRFLSGMLVTAAGYLAVALLPAWEPFGVVMFVLGLAFIGAHSVLQARATEAVPGARGTSVAVFACGLFLGGAIGTALFGLAIDAWGYRPTFAGLAAAMVAFSYAGWAVVRMQARATGA